MSRAAARRLALRRLLEQGIAANQEALVDRLARSGYRVTQTTVSRDLAVLGAQRVTRDGGFRYVLDSGTGQVDEAAATLADLMRTFVVRIDHSGNLVVIKTTPGAAHPVAAAIDTVTTTRLPSGGQAVPDRPAADPLSSAQSLDALLANEILATVAGDDTVLAVTRAADGGAAAALHFEDILEKLS